MVPGENISIIEGFKEFLDEMTDLNQKVPSTSAVGEYLMNNVGTDEQWSSLFILPFTC